MIFFLERLINFIANILILLVFIDSILSFFMSPMHPIRSALDRIVYPMLVPIRRVVPSFGSLDLSPLILIILIEIISYALIRILSLL
jgi:YggT family protein